MSETAERLLPVIPEGMTVDKLISGYVKLRDQIAAKEKEYKEALRPAKDMLDAMNNRLLDMLNQQGSNSMTAPGGTAYRIERTSASISDAEAFRNLVLANELFDLLDWKANKTAVKDYISEYGDAPAGVKWTVAYEVGVRRAGEK